MIRSIATVLSGTLLAQLIGLAALPVLSRLYGPDAFGTYQVYMATLSVLLMFVSLRYEVAILSARGRNRLVRLMHLIGIVGAVVLVLTVLVVWGFGGAIARSYPPLLPIIALLPAALFFGGTLQTATYLPIRFRDYRLAAVAKIVQALSYSVGGILMAFAPISLIGLVLADFAARMAASLTIVRSVFGRLGFRHTRFNWYQTWLVAGRFRDYPKFTFPGTLLSALSAAVVTYAFLNAFDLQTAGQYALVDRFILLPIAVTAGAVTQVFTGDFAELARQKSGNMNATFRRAVIYLAALAAMPMIAGMLLAQHLVPMIFGPEWRLAGELCAIAMPVALVRFVVGPVNMTLIICSRQSLQIVWEVSRFAITLGALAIFFLGSADNPVELMRLYVASVVLSYMAYLLLADFVTRTADRQQAAA